MTRHSAKHARPPKRSRPAERSRRRSHKRGSAGHVVLGGLGIAAVAGTIYLATGFHCIQGTQRHVKASDSLVWWVVHSVQDGWQKMECADYAKMSWEAVVWVGDQLKPVGEHLKQHPPRKL